MNNVELAIETLTDFSKQVTVKADGAYETTNFVESKKVAIAALEKQIPKKTKDEPGRYACPVCDETIERSDYEYCPKCGQKIGRFK